MTNAADMDTHAMSPVSTSCANAAGSARSITNSSIINLLFGSLFIFSASHVIIQHELPRMRPFAHIPFMLHHIVCPHVNHVLCKHSPFKKECVVRSEERRVGKECRSR